MMINPFRRPDPNAAVRDDVRATTLSWPGFRAIHVLGSKGGAGKTSAAALLALSLCRMRPELIGYADVNPDGSSAWSRLFPPGTPEPAPLLDLIAHADAIRAASDLAQFATRTDRLLAVTNDRADRAAREAMSAADYGTVRRVLAHFVQLLVTDGGTSLADASARSALAGSDQLVWAVEAIPQQIVAAENDIRYLLDSRDHQFVQSTVIAWLHRDPTIDLNQLRAVRAMEFFEQHCASVVTIPYDKHLTGGGTIALDQLHRRTRDAVEELTSAVAQQFPIRPVTWQRHDGLERAVKAAADQHDQQALAVAEQRLREFVASSGIRLDAVAPIARPPVEGGQR